MEERPKPRLREANREQVVPAIPLDALVAPDHPVRGIWEYVCGLDLSPLLDTIRAREGTPGRHATDPRILLAVWMWAVCDGVGTARAIVTLCREHRAYRWLAGGVTLNHHLLSDFRSNNEAALDRFFESHVAALLHLGVVELACVAQDGMRIRASAGAGSFHRAPSIQECQQRVSKQIAQLKRQDDEPLDEVARRPRGARQRHARQRSERLEQARQVAVELEAQKAARAKAHPKEAEQTKSAARAARARPRTRRRVG